MTKKQWFKSIHGLEVKKRHVILLLYICYFKPTEILIVPRWGVAGFADSTLLQMIACLKYFLHAGVFPLVNHDGYRFKDLCT